MGLGLSFQVLLYPLDPQTVSHSEPSGHHEDVLGESGILLGVGGFVGDLPGYEHGHDYGLARSRGHLGAEASEWASI